MIKTPFTLNLYKAFGLKKQKKEHFKDSIEAQYFQFENPRDANPHPDLAKLHQLVSDYFAGSEDDREAMWDDGKGSDPTAEVNDYIKLLGEQGIFDPTNINETVLRAFEDTGEYWPPDEGRGGGASGDPEHNPANQLSQHGIGPLLRGDDVPSWHNDIMQPYVARHIADPLKEHADMYNTYKLIQETNPDYQIPGFEVGGKYEQYMQPPPKQLADPNIIEGTAISIDPPEKPKELGKLLRKAFGINNHA